MPEHLAEVRDRKLKLLDKTEAAVKDRLTKEINYWDFRAEQLKEQERAGKANARLNSGEARKRADELQARLQKRMEDIKRERQLAPLPPVALGGLLVVPIGLIRAMRRAAAGLRANRGRHPGGRREGAGDRHGDRARSRLRAGRPGVRKARLRHRERHPRHRAAALHRGQGRVAGADTVTVTKNEILYSLNKPDDFILAMVAFGADGSQRFATCAGRSTKRASPPTLPAPPSISLSHNCSLKRRRPPDIPATQDGFPLKWQ